MTPTEQAGTSSADHVEWWEKSACGSVDPATFQQSNTARAKQICGGCPVRPECLFEALELKATGVWGSLTERERRALPVLPEPRAEALEVLRGILADRDDQETEPPAQEEEPPAPAPAADAKGPGFRYAPKDRARIADMLRAGASYAEIREKTGMSGPSALRIRRRAGIEPSGNTGAQTPRTVAEALAETVVPYGEGHARWTGPMAGRMAVLYAERSRFNARHVLFERHYGRPPVGRVCSSCGVTDCMAGPHLSDQELRRTQPQPAEKPVTVQALKNLLTEIDTQGGPQAARDNRLHLTDPSDLESTTMTTTEPVEQPATSIAQNTAEITAETLPVSGLLKWGDEHPDTDIRDQAARAGALLAGLRMRYAADKELTALNDEASQLEKRLAELRARQAELAPAKKAKRKAGTVVRDYDSRTVRAWAEENGIECPATGRVPKAVVDAWRAATASQDAQP